MLTFVLALLFAVNAPAQEVRAEGYNNQGSTLTVAVANKTQEYDLLKVQPITTLFDCEIIMAFQCRRRACQCTFTTSSAGEAKVIGVKDIKVQQKVWYGWENSIYFRWC